MHVVQTPLVHCSILEYWPIWAGPPVVLHTPLIHVVQKLLMHDVEVEVEVDDGIGIDGPRLGGIVGVTRPQLGLLLAILGFEQSLCQRF